MYVILQFFSDLGGMPLLITFGLYRIFPIRDFLREICLGYFTELSTSLLPMLLIQLYNNEEHSEMMTWIQITCLALRSLQLILLVLEILVLLYEARYNSKMRGLGFRNYKPRGGEERVRAYSDRMAKVTFVCVVVMISILVCGLSLTEGRSCSGKGNVLHWGVCTKCADANCVDCWQGPDVCNTCMNGYREDKVSGKCIDCDGDSKKKVCEKCHIGKNGENECLQCAEGYHYNAKTSQCEDC